MELTQGFTDTIDNGLLAHEQVKELPTEQQKLQYAMGIESNISLGSIAGLKFKEMTLQTEEGKKKGQEALESALQQAFENRRQEMLDDLDRQIRARKQDLADVDVKIAETKEEINNLSELQLLLVSGDYDATNSEHRALAERNGENPDTDPKEMLESVNTKHDTAMAALNKLQEERAVIVEDITKLEEAQNLIFDATDNEALDAAIEKINRSGITISVDANLSYDEKIVAVEEQLHKDSEIKAELLKDDLNTDLDITHLSTEEQVAFFVIKHAEHVKYNLEEDNLKNYASQLSDEAKQIITMTEEDGAGKFLTQETAPVVAQDAKVSATPMVTQENTFSIPGNG